MCGRYALYGPKSRDNVHPMDEWLDESFDFPPHYNAAPTQSMPIVRVDAKGGRECKALRWGLVPSWAKDAAIGGKLINARGETLAEKPSFRSAFRKRRCLVPMAGFYEWQTTPAGKIPHFIRVLNAQVFAVAGLYEWWPGKNGDPIESFTIVTTVANEFMAEVHARMPVILAPGDYKWWTDPANQDTASLQELLKPYASDEMTRYAVSRRVNNVRNDGPDLVGPEPHGSGEK